MAPRADAAQRPIMDLRHAAGARRVVLAVLATAVWSCACGSSPCGDGSAIRVGARHNPPYYFVNADGSVGGLGVDVVGQAAERLGCPVQWVPLTEPTLDALAAGRIDLWPTIPLLPRFTRGLHVTDPWLQSHFFILTVASGTVAATADLAGRLVAFSAIDDEVDRLGRALPGASLVRAATGGIALQQVCRGEAVAALLEARVGQALLLDRPAGCETTPMRFVPVEGASVPYAIGSTPAMAGVADAVRAEVGRLAEDGTLDAIVTRWTFITARESQTVYRLAESRRRARLAGYGTLLLAGLLALSVWQTLGARSARRTAERALTSQVASEERYRSLVENANDLVYVHDLQGRFLSLNRAVGDVTGYTLGDAATLDLFRVLAPEQVATARDLIRRIERGETPEPFELTVVARDGRRVTLEASARPVVQDGRVVAVQGIARDVTERRHLEDQLRQSQKLESIGRLAGGVAHDFNNLLTAINGYAELGLAGAPEATPVREALEQIRKAGERAADLTRQLLAFSRKQLLQPVDLDVTHLVTDIARLLARMIGEGIELVVASDPATWRVHADPGQMQQVLMNLAVNARDAMPGGGRLTIETANVTVGVSSGAEMPEGRYVRLRVSDSGQGMDEETLGRIFEPFFTTKAHGKGTGLGLATVYGIVTQSGGHLRVRSRPGQGTVFEVFLPALPEAAGQAAPSPPAP